MTRSRREEDIMDQENKITVNRLPARTWNRLGVNESRIDPVSGAVSGEYVLNRTARDIACRGDGCGEQYRMETGMGPEISRQLTDADTVYMRAAKGISYKDPAVIGYHYGTDISYVNRVAIDAEENSSLDVIVTGENTAAAGSRRSGAGTTAGLQITVQADPGAFVRIYVVQLLDPDKKSLTDIGIREETGAVVKLVRLDLGAGSSYTGVLSQLHGDRSVFEADTAYHARGEQNIDMNYEARHEGNKTVSRMDVSGVLRDSARKLFRGTIDFRRGCAGSKGDEKEDVLLLGENAVNQTVPLILCQEEDVEGNHGASIGELDDAVLFYMGSRGISRSDAEDMIAEAKVKAVAGLIPSEEIMGKVDAFLKKTMHERCTVH